MPAVRTVHRSTAQEGAIAAEWADDDLSPERIGDGTPNKKERG